MDGIGKEHTAPGIDEHTIDPDPIAQFRKWFEDASNAHILQPEAMTLATVSEQGRPSARIVLLKEVDARGFVFFTNYRSRKGKELAANPHAALVFHWPALKRQVRVEGVVEKVSPEESDAYFKSRIRESQIGAHASPQSEVVESRLVLDRRYEEVAREFAGGLVPRPRNWGGFRLNPERIEFWISGVARLHDRVLYERTSDRGWRKSRLAP